MNEQKFTATRVYSEEQRIQHHRLRYFTFCVEKGFEPAAQHPEGLERDAYDARATQILVARSQTECGITEYPATLRWISGRSSPLPTERIVGRTFPLASGREEVAELSRLIIRHVDRVESEAIFRALTSHVLDLADEQRVRYVIFLARPGLVRLLHRRGYPAIPFGVPVEHRGQRLPCYADLRTIAASPPGGLEKNQLYTGRQQRSPCHEK